MRYTPEWESLADALKRVIELGLSEDDAKLDLCGAVADRKISVRAKVSSTDRDLPGVSCSVEWLSVPVHLKPTDFDWMRCRPHKPWRIGPPVGPLSYSAPNLTWEPREIDLIELATSDVQSVFGSSPTELQGNAKQESNQSSTDETSGDTVLGSNVVGAPQRATKMPPMPEKPGPRKEAWKGLKEKFRDGWIPNHYSGATLHKIVNQHIEKLPCDVIEGRIRQQISLDTVLRAAGRKK